MKQMNNIQSHAWSVKYNFTDAKLTSDGGISFVVYLAKASGLVGLLKGLNGTLKKRRRGVSETQSLLAQVYLLVMKKGPLSDLEDARVELVFRVLTGLGEMPDSRRVDEFLSRFVELNLARLREFSMRWLDRCRRWLCGMIAWTIGALLRCL